MSSNLANKLHKHYTGRTGTDGKHTYSSTLSLNSVLEGCRWSSPCHPPVAIVHKAGRIPGRFWTRSGSLVPTGIRSPDRPRPSSESLYGLFGLHRILNAFNVPYVVNCNVRMLNEVQHCNTCGLQELQAFRIRESNLGTSKYKQ